MPGPIWKAAMLGAVADLPVEQFVPIDSELIDGAQVTMPSLAGLSRKAAVKRLERLGLSAEVSSTTVLSFQPEGTVAYTTPGAGTTVEPGDTIVLFLSNGEPPPPEPEETKKNGGGGGSNDGGTPDNNGGGNNGGGNNGGGGNN